MGQKIDEVRIAPPGEWRDNHLDLLDESFQDAPFRRDALQLVEEVYRDEYTHLGAIARASLLSLSNYFGLNQDTHFADVKPLNIGGSGSDRVLSVIKHFGADTYITGHGASRYLDNEELERTGVNVMYMKYRNLPYPQSHGEFTPYVTGLDLVAHCGREGVQYISPQTVSWSEFANE